MNAYCVQYTHKTFIQPVHDACRAAGGAVNTPNIINNSVNSKNVGMHISIHSEPIIIIIKISSTNKVWKRRRKNRCCHSVLSLFDVTAFEPNRWCVCVWPRWTHCTHIIKLVSTLSTSSRFFLLDSHSIQTHFKFVGIWLARITLPFSISTSATPNEHMQHRHDILSIHRLNQLTPFNWVPSKRDLVVNESIDTHSNFCLDILCHHHHPHRPTRDVQHTLAQCALVFTIHSLTKTILIIKNPQS